MTDPAAMTERHRCAHAFLAALLDAPGWPLGDEEVAALDDAVEAFATPTRVDWRDAAAKLAEHLGWLGPDDDEAGGRAYWEAQRAWDERLCLIDSALRSHRVRAALGLVDEPPVPVVPRLRRHTAATTRGACCAVPAPAGQTQRPARVSLLLAE